MTDIFIAYCHEDRKRVRFLAEAFAEEGWSVFWDRKIPTGLTWHSFVGKALTEARCVVVAWSEDAVQSDWVLEEAGHARARNVLIPVLLDPVAPPLGFGGVQALDLREWLDDADSPVFRQLVTDMERLLGPPPSLEKRAEEEATRSGEKEKSEAENRAEQRRVDEAAGAKSREYETQPRAVAASPALSLSNFEYEIFISYAQRDDVTFLEGQKGWVSVFHEALKVLVGQHWGREPRIWRDTEVLKGDEQVNDYSLKALRRAAVFVMILSPSYLRSERCMSELREFHQAGQVVIGNLSRIFKVMKTPVPFDEHPEQARDLLGFRFFAEDPATGRSREFDTTFGDGRELYKAIEELAQDMKRMFDSQFGS